MAEFIVGVTGGIGSGKTLVTDAFAAKGVVIADADEAARHIVEPGQPALAQIVAHFGEGIIDSSGRLDRPKLREIVFNDVDARRQLESFTHRPIMEALANQLQSATSAYAMLVLSAGLGNSPLIDRMLVVDADESVRVHRVMARDGSSESLVRQIMASQPSSEERRNIADDVIENNGDTTTVLSEVDRLHHDYLELAHR
ncbi:MAG: dephospho-CoA kinase [Pseudomonadota bacterium]|nr:dephospho-CoA kinase [Pseudomonadota bacterium]